MAQFDRSRTSSYSSSIVTMTIYCIVSEIKLDIGQKRQFFIPLSFNLHDRPEALDFFPKILVQLMPDF